VTFGAVPFYDYCISLRKKTKTTIIAEEHVDINGFVHTGMMQQPCRASDRA